MSKPALAQPIQLRRVLIRSDRNYAVFPHRPNEWGYYELQVLNGTFVMTVKLVQIIMELRIRLHLVDFDGCALFVSNA